VPAAIRIASPTVAGEGVSVWGYGLTEQAQDPILLRVRDDAYIVAVGPETPLSTTQPAPVRSLRIGPGSVTCNGDSGAPIFSAITGAVIGIVSLGAQATTGLFCTDDSTSDGTTGPLLSDYSSLALSAFAAAGATPILETPPTDGGYADASAPADGGGLPGELDADEPAVDESPSLGVAVSVAATGASCGIGAEHEHERRRPWALLGILLLAAVVARRHGS
jgi:hypothetical protein